MVCFCASCVGDRPSKTKVVLNDIVAGCGKVRGSSKWWHKRVVVSFRQILLVQIWQDFIDNAGLGYASNNLYVKFLTHLALRDIDVEYTLWLAGYGRCAGDRVTMTYCARDRAYQNQPDVLLNEGYSFHVLKRLPLLAHGYSGQITRTVPVTGNE